MQFQFDIGSSSTPPKPLPPVTESVPELLRHMYEMQRDQLQQLLDVQKEHLHFARASSPDSLQRWRTILARWEKEFPEFAGQCRKAYPLMERAYIQLLANMVDELTEQGDEALENEFAVQEFLDRYGMKVGQLSHLLGIIGPLSEAAHQQEEAAKQQG